MSQLLSADSSYNHVTLHPTQHLKLDPLTRERSRSASDFERLSIMDEKSETTLVSQNIDRDNDSASPPLTVVKESRSHSLTPEPLTRYPHYATLGRPMMKRGKTIDTSSIRKEEHEVCLRLILGCYSS